MTVQLLVLYCERLEQEQDAEHLIDVAKTKL